MMLLPDWITTEMHDSAVVDVGRKNPPVGLHKLRLETLTEGRCVQTLHVGSYDDEAQVLLEMHQEFIPSLGLELTGRHHEIYLNDPRRVLPSRLRTILRQPVLPADV